MSAANKKDITQKEIEDLLIVGLRMKSKDETFGKCVSGGLDEKTAEETAENFIQSNNSAVDDDNLRKVAKSYLSSATKARTIKKQKWYDFRWNIYANLATSFILFALVLIAVFCGNWYQSKYPDNISVKVGKDLSDAALSNKER